MVEQGLPQGRVTFEQRPTNMRDVKGQKSPRENVGGRTVDLISTHCGRTEVPTWASSGRAGAPTRIYGGQAEALASRVDGRV